MRLDIGKQLRDLMCSHRSMATHTQAFSKPHPHVISRTMCLDCGRAVSPGRPVSQDVLHDLLQRAAREAKANR